MYESRDLDPSLRCQVTRNEVESSLQYGSRIYCDTNWPVEWHTTERDGIEHRVGQTATYGDVADCLRRL